MEINWTLAIQFLIYVSLIVILKKLYFDPLVGVLNRRESLTAGREEEADELLKKTTELKAEYESKLHTFRHQLEMKKSEAAADVRAGLDTELQSAKVKAEKNLETQRAGLEKEISKLRERIPQLANEIKNEIVTAITSSKVVNL